MEIWIRFAVQFDGMADGSQDPWPKFSEWLPNGQEDALDIPTGNDRIELQLWFERYGFLDGNLLRFDLEQRLPANAKTPKQAPLDAGPLHGLLKWGVLDKSHLDGLNAGPESEGYIELGKLIYDFLQPKLAATVETIRTVFGQYWVPSFPDWDSRHISLGSYFMSALRAKWSLDEGTTWQHFSPEMAYMNLEMFSRHIDGNQYLSEDDWRGLADCVQERRSFSLASQTIARAMYMNDEGRCGHALVDAVTSLELAIGEYLGDCLRGIEGAVEKSKPFHQLPMPARLAVLVGALDIDSESVEKALEAIELRNRVVHDGHILDHGERLHVNELLQGTREVIGKLSSPEIVKTPLNNIGIGLLDDRLGS